MGAKMTISDLGPKRLQAIRESYCAYEQFTKTTDSDGWVVSATTGLTENAPVPALELGAEQARDLITRLEFMQVARCDQVRHLWQAETVNLIALLKKRFHSSFGSALYD